MPTKLRRHLETEKLVRKLHVINGSVYYRVIYSQGGIGWTTIQKHSALPRGHWDNLMANLEYWRYVLGNRTCIPKSRFMMGN